MDLRNIILNAKEPMVLKNTLDWSMLEWSLTDWKELLKDKQLKFRCGNNSHTEQPQWERTTNEKHMTFENFISLIKDEEKWYYFDYKYLREWLCDVKSLQDSINWKSFGFPEYSYQDSTIWLGSSRAHTPCHVDTYGCNIVAQIFGRKQWLLFPPEENLYPTRIPYEESSVYSKLNFFSPTVEHFKGVKNGRMVVLEPGDVLVVPHKWWHYVENIDIAISVNLWIPLPVDKEELLGESIVQLLITQIVNSTSVDVKQNLLNPNSDEAIDNGSLNESLDLITKCRELCNNLEIESIDTVNINSVSMTPCNIVKNIPIMTDNDFIEFITHQQDRFADVSSKCSNETELYDVINALTHPDVISLIKNKLLKK